MSPSIQGTSIVIACSWRRLVGKPEERERRGRGFRVPLASMAASFIF